VDLPGQKDRALLAFLAMGNRDVQSRERLAGLLWSRRGEQQARDSLKQALVRVRRSLGGTNGTLLRADRRSVTLDRSMIAVDALTFERLVQLDAVEPLTEATSIYRGDLLDGIAVHDPAFEDWLLLERQRLRQLFERALAALMAKLLAAGDRERATAAARRLLLSDPLSEAAYRTLMQIHADDGQTAQALKLYDGLRGRLHRELGVRPEPATVALHDQLRRRIPATLVPPLPPRDESERTPGSGLPSIAVLPFLNLSGDPRQQYFIDGIAEDLITELSRFRTLTMLPRNASFQYRGGSLDVVRIGRELAANYLVEGSVRLIAGGVRVSAQLVDASTGNSLWTEDYDRTAPGILTVQDEVVRAIATTLGCRIAAAGHDRAMHLAPESLSAYDHVLRSEVLFLRFTRDDNAEARRLAEMAVEIDPKSAQAHAQLGLTHCMDHGCGWVADRARALDAAFALARHAVQLDEVNCRARWLLGFVHNFRREYDDARAQLRRAIALNPNDVEAHGIYGVHLVAVGEPEAALDQFDTAKRHNLPEFNWVTLCRGAALFTARRYDEAIAVLTHMHNPNMKARCWLAASYGAAGRLPEARQALTEFLAVAEREMPVFPGGALDPWKPYLHGFVEYRDERDFEYLFGALRAAGLE
jgi:TolB-like protein/DNA-binding SARP family transcriptional activator/Flp pilus assembly protein TadD